VADGLLCKIRPLHIDMTLVHCLMLNIDISIPAYGVSGVLYKAIETVESAYIQESCAFSSESLQNKPINAYNTPKNTEAQNADSSPIVAKGIPCQSADKLQDMVMQNVRVKMIKQDESLEFGNVLNISPEAPYKQTNALKMMIEYAIGPNVCEKIKISPSAGSYVITRCPFKISQDEITYVDRLGVIVLPFPTPPFPCHLSPHASLDCFANVASVPLKNSGCIDPVTNTLGELSDADGSNPPSPFCIQQNAWLCAEQKSRETTAWRCLAGTHQENIVGFTAILLTPLELISIISEECITVSQYGSSHLMGVLVVVSDECE
jgi:hypothetical protein